MFESLESVTNFPDAIQVSEAFASSAGLSGVSPFSATSSCAEDTPLWVQLPQACAFVAPNELGRISAFREEQLAPEILQAGHADSLMSLKGIKPPSRVHVRGLGHGRSVLGSACSGSSWSWMGWLETSVARRACRLEQGNSP